MCVYFDGALSECAGIVHIGVFVAVCFECANWEIVTIGCVSISICIV